MAIDQVFSAVLSIAKKYINSTIGTPGARPLDDFFSVSILCVGPVGASFQVLNTENEEVENITLTEAMPYSTETDLTHFKTTTIKLPVGTFDKVKVWINVSGQIMGNTYSVPESQNVAGGIVKVNYNISKLLKDYTNSNEQEFTFVEGAKYKVVACGGGESGDGIYAYETGSESYGNQRGGDGGRGAAVGIAYFIGDGAQGAIGVTLGEGGVATKNPSYDPGDSVPPYYKGAGGATTVFAESLTNGMLFSRTFSGYAALGGNGRRVERDAVISEATAGQAGAGDTTPGSTLSAPGGIAVGSGAGGGGGIEYGGSGGQSATRGSGAGGGGETNYSAGASQPPSGGSGRVRLYITYEVNR